MNDALMNDPRPRDRYRPPFFTFGREVRVAYN